MKTKHTGKICILLLLLLIPSFGGDVEVFLNKGMEYETAGIYASLTALATISIISIVMMLVPFICRLARKEKLPYKSGKRLCLWNGIITFVIAVVVAATTGILMISIPSAIIFYFINKWVFVKAPNDTNTQVDQRDMKHLVEEKSTKTHAQDTPQMSLSFTDEEHTTHGTYSVSGDDIRLGQHETESKETIRTPQIQNTEIRTDSCRPSKKKYCSRCGMIIDISTHKCTGCGKQYFKGVPWKRLSIVMLSIFFAASVVANVFLCVNNRDLVTDVRYLEKRNDRLEDDVDDLQEELDQFYDYYEETFNKIAFFDRVVVFIEDDGTNRYHKYDCDQFIGNSFWAYNVEAAESKGFDPCPICCE